MSHLNYTVNGVPSFKVPRLNFKSSVVFYGYFIGLLQHACHFGQIEGGRTRVGDHQLTM